MKSLREIHQNGHKSDELGHNHLKIFEEINDRNYVKHITLCGSHKFDEEIDRYNAYYTLLGNTIYAPVKVNKIGGVNSTEEIQMLRNMHFKKIEESDAVIIINQYNYIGHDTFLELIHAIMHKKCIIFINTKQEFDDSFIFNLNKEYPLYMLEMGSRCAKYYVDN